MNTIKKYTPAIASILLMYVVLCIIYPHYQYYIDPDSTSYLTISQRYAKGDYSTAINGYWSPWSCWLTAIVIKAGMAAIPASIIINILGATCFLLISQSFFIKFNIIWKLQWLLCNTIGLFLCYAIFWQSFDDLWECFFLLSTLRIILSNEFKSRPILWIGCGVAGALAYFAKAYSFPFFILNTLCCTYFICKENKVQWLKISIVCIGIMILFSLPWIYLLHNKYGIWTTATAGTLNTSWYLTGHPHWKTGIDMLLPPAYKDSPYYWEDPYFANGDTPHFWDSWHLFWLQLLRAGYNMLKLLVSMLQISVLLPAISTLAIFSLRSKSALFEEQARIVIISCLLFPLGYVLINFESRYIWYVLPLGMLLGALLIQDSEEGLWKKIVLIIFPITFLIYPIYSMAKMYDVGKQEYLWAQDLKKNNIKGSFASMSSPGISAQATERLAYFSGCNYYANWCIGNDQKLLKEMRRYDIQYYIITPYSSLVSEDSVLRDEKGMAFPKVKMKRGLIVFKVENQDVSR